MALPDYLQDTGKDLARQMTAAYSAPLDTSKFMGSQFVAGQDQAQTDAYGLATQGVGSYKPYLTAAQTAAGQAAGTVGGLGALTGPMTGQQLTDYTSPYQGAVIDETLRQYDISRTGGRQSIQDAAVGTGNFGGGREGAMLGQYDADTTAGRASLLAGLQQQGFTQANQLAQQAFANQGTLAQNQFGLSNFQRTGLGQDIGALGNLGALNQQQAQANLRANQLAQQTAAYEPYGRLQQYGQGLTGLAGGVASAYAEPAPVQSPLSQALSTALGVGGIYSRLYGGPKI